MRVLNGIKLTEKEFRHVKAQYLRFAKEENQCTHKCPMGWEDTNGIGLSRVGKSVYTKTRGSYNVSCCCHIFHEFKIPGCPCASYGSDAFRRLAIVVKRLKRME